MQNKALAQMVLQKIKEKKEEQQRNMPHFKILQLQTTFDYQRNLQLKQEMVDLQNELASLQSTLATMQERSEQLQYTGKRNFPRIIVKPDFIASEKIEFKLKDFYRKLSNTFLRLEIFRNKKIKKSQQICDNLTSLANEITLLQKQCRKKKEQQRVQTNNKRKKVQKQKLRLEKINEQIEQIKNTIKKEREDNIVLIEEYQLKHGGMEKRKQRLAFVQSEIKFYKKKIEEEFKPMAYREHLSKVSILQAKNQLILERLRAVNTQISSRNSSEHSTAILKSKKRLQHSARNKDQRLKTQSFFGGFNKNSFYIGNMSTMDLTNDKASLTMSNLKKIDSQQEMDKCKLRFRSEQSQNSGNRHSFYSKLTKYVLQNKRKDN